MGGVFVQRITRDNRGHIVLPLNRIKYSVHGEEEERIGPNKFTTDRKIFTDLEALLETNAPLPITCDVFCTQPPYFSEFVYNDILDGLLVQTLSGEINRRVYKKISQVQASDTLDLGKVLDKYALIKPRTRYRKVIMMTGSNSLHMVDQNKLQELMADDEWVIKLHPVTVDETIRELASVYGYHRLIAPDESGMALLEAADEIASLTTSEMFIVGRLMGKPVHNITRHTCSWLGAYSGIIDNLRGTDDDVRLINNMLFSEASGYVRPEWSNALKMTKLNNFFELAMTEREIFKMQSSQLLSVSDKTIVKWGK